MPRAAAAHRLAPAVARQVVLTRTLTLTLTLTRTPTTTLTRRHRALACGAAGWRHAARGRRLALLRLRVGFAATRAALHAWREGAVAAARARLRSARLGAQRPSALAAAAAHSISPRSQSRDSISPRISPRSRAAAAPSLRSPAGHTRSPARRAAAGSPASPPPPHAPHQLLAPRPSLCTAAAWDAWAGRHAERVHARAQCGRAAAFWRLARLIAATNAWQEACL